MSNKKTLGLYLHIPFCRAKCSYCDFCSFPAVKEEEKRGYVTALCTELKHLAKEAEGYAVDTVFFGGGTPTCLEAEELCTLANCIKTHYTVTKDVEWTSEANPATVDERKLSLMREAGFNRISLGMQSAHEKELRALGRIHTPSDLFAAVDALRVAGFENFSLDLMFGIPHQTEESFAHSLDQAMSLAPKHLSVYSLQLEEGTPFYEKQNTLSLPSEEEEAAMADLLYRKTEAHGYLRYEISNFALQGYESRHNLRYWQMQDYLGFGVAAHSCFAGKRFYNRAELSAYLATPLGLREEEEILTAKARESETIMLGLRLCHGIEEAHFKSVFGYGFYTSYAEKIRDFIRLGLMEHTGTHTRLTARGMALSNSILAELLPDF